MELNRNQYFMIGLVVLFLGIQVKCVDSYVLTEKAAAFMAKRLNKDQAAATSGPIMQSFTSASMASPPVSYRAVEPPAWLGWALISIGSVLILHSLAMGKPGG
jgi:hypothetical protein